jgi:hypothetical protein
MCDTVSLLFATTALPTHFFPFRLENKIKRAKFFPLGSPMLAKRTSNSNVNIRAGRIRTVAYRQVCGQDTDCLQSVDCIGVGYFRF